MELIRPFMNFSSSLQLARVAAVIVLLGVAAAISTPRGRLPLALRGLAKMTGSGAVAGGSADKVSALRKMASLILLTLAIALVFCKW